MKVVYLFGVCTLVGMEHMHRQHETEFNEQIAGNKFENLGIQTKIKPLAPVTDKNKHEF